jgi:heat shock protein HslJ
MLRLGILLSLGLAAPVLAQDTALAGPWKVTEIDGTAVPEGVEVTMEFAAGRVAGRGGCNRYTAAADQNGTGLRLGPPAATKMACPGPGMATETAFFAALPRIDGAKVTGDRLVLTGGGAVLLQAMR